MRSSGCLSFDGLTAREREVLEILARGLNNSEIAGRLKINEKTARNHVSIIFSKLGVGSRTQAVVLAREAGFGRRMIPEWCRIRVSFGSGPTLVRSPSKVRTDRCNAASPNWVRNPNASCGVAHLVLPSANMVCEGAVRASGLARPRSGLVQAASAASARHVTSMSRRAAAVWREWPKMIAKMRYAHDMAEAIISGLTRAFFR